MISSLALAAVVVAPVFVAAHGQLSWIQIGGGQQYSAWNLDDYYTAVYKETDPVWGEVPDQKYSRKFDDLDLGPASVFNNTIATGGYDIPKRFDDLYPVGVIPAKAGDEVVIQWGAEWPDEHPGPIGEWMAKCPGDSCTKVDGTTLDWFSIAQHNWDADLKEWPTTTFVKSLNKQWTFKLPTDLPGGAYIIRHSLIGYQNDTGPIEGLKSTPQHYPVGIEINLESSGTTLPSETCKFPGCFSYDDYEWHHNIYDEEDSGTLGLWEFPGIAVYPGGYTTGVVNGKSAGQGTSGTPSSSGTSPASSSAAASPAESSASSASSSNSVTGTASEAGVATSTGATSPAVTSQSAAFVDSDDDDDSDSDDDDDDDDAADDSDDDSDDEDDDADDDDDDADDDSDDADDDNDDADDDSDDADDDADDSRDDMDGDADDDDHDADDREDDNDDDKKPSKSSGGSGKTCKRSGGEQTVATPKRHLHRSVAKRHQQ
ncbi:hypothetical protein IAT38_004352 [Cryptococcus sp. DSM 104549]